MDRLAELQSELSKYYNLKNSVGTIVIPLSKAIDTIEIASNKIGENYLIDSNPADSNKVIADKERLIEKKNFLVSSVNPAIDIQIARIKREIEAEIERRRQEAVAALATKLM